MGHLFRLLSKELIFLGVLFLVIVPFVLNTAEGYAARQQISQFGTQAQDSFQTVMNGGSFDFPQAGLRGGGGNSYVKGRPIHLPQ